MNATSKYDEFGDDDGNPRPIWAHEHEARPCTFQDIFKVSDDGPPDSGIAFIEGCNEYLSIFAAPIMVPQYSTIPDSEKVMGCLHCGAPLTGMFAGLLSRGGFTWGLAHGEGHCAACHWPARAYHSAKNKDGSELFTLRPFVLQYLPDFEAEKNAASASEALR